MNDIVPGRYTPRTVAAVRAQRAVAAGLLMRNGFRRLKRWLIRHLERLHQTQQRWRDMNMLLRADERVLKDIGLTRGDAQAMAEGWLSSGEIAKAAAARRNEAIAASEQRRRAIAGAAKTGIVKAGTVNALSRVPVNDNSQSCRIAANASGSKP